MNVYTSLESFPKLSYAVVTGGVFDGVHMGHQKILRRVREVAQQNQGQTVVYTFSPHPRLIIYKAGSTFKMLSTKEEKMALLEKHDVDHLLIIPFTESFSKLSYLDFIATILVKNIGAKNIIIGHNHHFGKNREGNLEKLMQVSDQYGFEVEKVYPETVQETTVSSSKIREALTHGKVDLARHLLGRPYTLSGKVVEGNKIGLSLGFPTANIELKSDLKLIPATGVYAVTVRWKDTIYAGMLNIGYRPTLNHPYQTIEVHLLDFDHNLYGQHLTIFFYQFIRLERKFTDLNELKKQLHHDRQICLSLLSDISISYD